MKHNPPRKGLRTLALALALATVFLASGPAAAAVQPISLRADTTTVTLEDGTSVDMWGYGLAPGGLADCGTAGVSVPGPLLVVDPGNSLEVTLYNCLGEPTSLVIPGQAMPDGSDRVWLDEGGFSHVSAGRGGEGWRIRSFTHEAPAGGSAVYTWTDPIEPGTYLYESGTHPAKQISMGLYGALKNDVVADAEAYTSTAATDATYDVETIVLWHEIDPNLHLTLETPNPVNYKPSVYPVHTYNVAGEPEPFTRLTLTSNTRHLVRLLNAGLKTRVPVLYGHQPPGLDMSLIAEDGNLYPYPLQQASALLPARKTLDAILEVPFGVSGTYALADRRLWVSAVETNQAPEAVADFVTVMLAGPPVVIPVLANDNDPDGNTFVIDSIDLTGTVGGVVCGLSDCTYAPVAAGVDTFTYTIKDLPAEALSPPATVTVTVVAGSAPTADDQLVLPVVPLGSPVNITLTASDPDVPPDPPLSFSIVDSPAHGSLTGTPPNVTYTPDPGYSGVDTFTFQADDGFFQSNIATVTIPIASNILLRDDFNRGPDDIVGNALTPVTPWTELEFGATPSAIEVSADGALHLAAPLNLRTFHELLGAPHSAGRIVWSFDFDWTLLNLGGYIVRMQLADQLGNIPISLHWGNYGAPGTLAYQTSAGDVPLTPLSGKHRISVEANLDLSVYSVSVDGDLLASGIPFNVPVAELSLVSFSSFSFPFVMIDGRRFDDVIVVGIPPAAPTSLDQALVTPEDTPLPITLGGSPPYTVVTPPANGGLSGSLPNVTYTPDPDWNGVDGFTYQANGVTGNVSITVTPVNDAPVAQDLGPLYTGMDTPLPITLLGDDPADGDSLIYMIGTPPAHGDISGTAPNIVYTPDPRYRGLDSFTMLVFDGTEKSNFATVSIVVGMDELLLDDFDRANSSTLGNALTPATPWLEVEGPLAPNGIELAGNMLHLGGSGFNLIAAHDLLDAPHTAGRLVWEFDLDWTLVTPGAGYVARMQLADGSGTAAVSLLWTSVDAVDSTLAYQAPAGGGSVALTTLSGPHRITVEADLDLAEYAVSVDGTLVAGRLPFVMSVPSGITQAVFSSFVTPSADITGRTFDLAQVWGGAGGANPALDQSLATDEDQDLNLTLGGAGPYTIISPPLNGVLSGGAPNLLYTPNGDFNGADSFTFADGSGDVGLISIAVAPVNDAPVAVNDAAATPANLTVTLSVLANDTDVDGDTLIFVGIGAGPTNGGSVTCSAGGVCVFTPGAVGVSTFDYVISDGNGGLGTGAATVDVTASAAATLLLDGFNRPASPDVGNEWEESEAPGAQVEIGPSAP